MNEAHWPSRVLSRSHNPGARKPIDDHGVESAFGGLEDWGKLIGDVPAATATLDSLPRHAEVIAMTGRSYRLQARAGKEGQKDRPRKKPASEGPDKQKSSCQKTQE